MPAWSEEKTCEEHCKARPGCTHFVLRDEGERVRCLLRADVDDSLAGCDTLAAGDAVSVRELRWPHAQQSSRSASSLR